MADLRENIGSVAQQAKEGTRGLVDAATEQARQAAGAVSGFASDARHRVEDWAGQASERLGNVRESVTDWSSHAYENTEDVMKNATREVSGLIRSYPIPALLIGFGVGFLLAQLTERRR